MFVMQKLLILTRAAAALAGTFGMQAKNQRAFKQIASVLVTAIDAATANCVLTECSACKMQIEHLTAKTAQHPIKILARAYSLM